MRPLSSRSSATFLKLLSYKIGKDSPLNRIRFLGELVGERPNLVGAFTLGDGSEYGAQLRKPWAVAQLFNSSGIECAHPCQPPSRFFAYCSIVKCSFGWLRLR